MIMGSGGEAACETADFLNAHGERVGVLQVRLYRPFDTRRFRSALPSSVKALAELGQIYREVFVLRDMQHLSIEETAKALGISTASVKTRLLRARLMLRDLLAPGLGGAWSMTSKLSFVKGTKPW